MSSQSLTVEHTAVEGRPTEMKVKKPLTWWQKLLKRMGSMLNALKWMFVGWSLHWLVVFIEEL